MNMFSMRSAAILAFLAIFAGSLFAQPASTDLGTLTDLSAVYATADYTDVGAHTAGQVRWIRFTLPNPVNIADGTFLDIDTSTTFGSADTEIGLYSSTGALITSDDDDGDGAFSALTFGQTTPTRGPIGTGLAGNGRDGALAAGLYYLAIAEFNSTFNATAWNVTSTGTGTGNTTIFIRTNIVPPGDPEINVEQPVSTSIVSGGTLAAGTQTSGIQFTRTFTVRNQGATQNLNVTSVSATPTGVANCTVSTTALTPASPVAPAGTATFDLNVTPTAAGAFQCTVTIVNNDVNEGTYTVIVSGTADLPVVTSVSPSQGPAAGGQNVTVTGLNFTGATSITFGGTAASPFVVVNATTITCATPVHAAGVVSVLVTGPGGTNVANTLYTYVAAPTVTAVAPNVGPITGGTTVTITGTAFSGVTGVTFGGTAATSVIYISPTSISCVTPAHAAGLVSVNVTTPFGTNAANTLFGYGAPVLTSVSPATGPTAATAVTLNGSGFTGVTTVTFAGTAATGVTFVNDNTITCTTPVLTTGAKSVLITTPNGTNLANTAYTVQAAPTVTGISPNAGPISGGTSVTITGTAFLGATGVTIGGTAATSVVVVSATSITCVTPAGAAGAASVNVTTPSGTNAANTLFTYGPPSLTSVSPNSGPTAGGQNVTLTGIGFTGVTNVTFAGTAATGITFVSDTSITCVTPAGAAGNASVIVTTPSGSNPANTAYAYQASPTVTAISPNVGSTLGGAFVTITGTGFLGATGVTIGGSAATTVAVVTATSITCFTPAGAVGTASVLVTTPSGTNAANTLYTYAVAPSNDVVANATALTLNRAVAGTLVAASNDYQIQAASTKFIGVGHTVTTAPGRDVIYTFTAPAAGRYTFRTHFGTVSNQVVYLLNTAPVGTAPVSISDASILYAANRNTNTSNVGEALFNVSLTAAQQVYLVVDELAVSAGGTFVVEVSNSVLETEPNGTPGAAATYTWGMDTAISVSGDLDFFSLGTPAVGSRVFAMTDTSAGGGSQDSIIRVTTATDTLQYDDDSGDTPFGVTGSTTGRCSNIAGCPTTGAPTFLEATFFGAGGPSEPWKLYCVVQPPSASATTESEPNDTIAQANVGANNYFSGTLSAASDVDMYAFYANAGDEVYLGLDMSPARTATTWNGVLALLDSTGATLLQVDDTQTAVNTTAAPGTLTATNPSWPSEGLVFRVQTGGVYYARVTASTTFGTYLLSVSKNGGIGGGGLLVTNLNDSGAGSLRDCVANASATLPGNSIFFQSGLTGTITLASEIAINKPLAIVGPGAAVVTVSGNNAVRCFHIGTAAPSQPSTVTIGNLRIANGRAGIGSNFGGGARSANATIGVVFDGVVFENNTSPAASGGGLQITAAASVLINNCTFTGNTCPAGGAGGANLQASTTISNCVFTNNTTLNAPAGFGIPTGTAVNLTVTNTTISNNTATSATSFGGGVQLVIGGSPTISFSGCTISGNSASEGGGISIVSNAAGTATTTMTNCTISGNTATVGDGGGIEVFPAVTGATSNLTLTNCTVAANTAPTATAATSIYADGVAGATANVSYQNTIISGAGSINIGTASSGGTTTFTSLNNNLCSDATGNLIAANDLPSTPANLAALANNGGPTLTHMLLGTSAALDKGRAIAGITTDQRGNAKPVDIGTITNASNGDGSDIGAVEAPATLAPIITSAAPADGLINTAYNHTYTATGIPATFTFTVTAGALPTGLSLSAAGVISGTPTVSGNFTGTVTCANGIAPDATQAFSININEAPAITNANSTTFTVGTAGNFNFTATGFPATFTWTTVSTLPTGVTLTAGGVLSGTPAAGTGGTYVLAIVCSNGVAPDGNQSFTLTVNEAPSITSANNTTFTVGSAGTFSHTASGFPAAMTFTNIGVALPTGVTLTTAGVLSGTPAAGTGGTYALIINANNGVTPDDQQNFTLTVNEAPTITSAAPSSPAVQGAAYNHTYTATGFPATFTFTVTSGALPTGLSLSGAGVISGNATATGVFTGTVSCSNGVSPDATQNFSITIIPPGPNIAVSTLNLTLTNTTQGVAGNPGVSYTVGGTNLTADIVLAAPTNVEIALALGGPYSAGFTLTQTGGTVATTTIFARITAGAPQGAVSGNITHTSTGATQRDVAVTGTVAPPVPDINVQRAGTDIADGASDAQGTVPFGIAQVVTYTIQNTGLGGLTITASPALVNITGTPGNCTANVTTQPSSSSIAAAGSLTFVITYTVTTAAAFNFDVQIVSNDPDAESTYDFQVLGTGGSVPEINVTRSGAIADGGTDALGNNVEGTAIVLTYSIANAGNSALTITPPVTLTGLVNCTAVLTTAPGVSVAAAGSTPMVITVTPLAAGSFSCVVTVINDDADEGTYNWTISGTGTSSGGGGGGGGGGGDGGGCSTGESNSLWMLAGALAAFGLALRLRRKLA